MLRLCRRTIKDNNAVNIGFLQAQSLTSGSSGGCAAAEGVEDQSETPPNEADDVAVSHPPPGRFYVKGRAVRVRAAIGCHNRATPNTWGCPRWGLAGNRHEGSAVSTTRVHAAGRSRSVGRGVGQAVSGPPRSVAAAPAATPTAARAQPAARVQGGPPVPRPPHGPAVVRDTGRLDGAPRSRLWVPVAATSGVQNRVGQPTRYCRIGHLIERDPGAGESPGAGGGREICWGPWPAVRPDGPAAQRGALRPRAGAPGGSRGSSG
jgi:hypothetical protein